MCVVLFDKVKHHTRVYTIQYINYEAIHATMYPDEGDGFDQKDGDSEVEVPYEEDEATIIDTWKPIKIHIHENKITRLCISTSTRRPCGTIPCSC